VAQTEFNVDTQLIVAVLGFGAAALGFLATVLGRKKEIIHRDFHEQEETEGVSTSVKWGAILLLIAGLTVGGVMSAVHFLKPPGIAPSPQPDVKADVAEYQKQNLVAKGAAYLQKTGPARLDFWRQAAQQGSPEGQFLFSRCLQEGAGIAKNEGESAVWLRKAAEQGFAPAQNSLGECYYFGQGVAQDFAEMVLWFRKAADQGEPGSQDNLGNCYRYALGVAKDSAEGARWYRKAAEQGAVLAQYHLGCCYRDGEGVGKDLAEAIRWFRPAADQGLKDAQYMIGASIRDGWVAKGDPIAAILWFRKAADQDDVAAQYMLGVMYFHGEGVAKDPVEGVRWYRKAANQGNDWAQNALGRIYEHGQGVDKKDLAEAVRWYQKAAAQGNAEATKALGSLVKDARGADVLAFADTKKDHGGSADPNAKPWTATVVKGVPNNLDGEWASRWKHNDKDAKWNVGTAQVKAVGERLFIQYKGDGGGEFLIKLQHVGKDKLVGRYVNLDKQTDSTPWVGFVVNSERIDGYWTNGRWDLQRKLEK
jgi:TPR repeat protein